MNTNYIQTLNTLQVGRLGECLARIWFAQAGFQVYVPEVDDRGVDLLVHRPEVGYVRIQIKTVRNLNYTFMRKATFSPASDLWLTLGIMRNGAQDLYLIPSEVWNSPNKVFVDRDYTDKESPPEYGINLSETNLAALEPYRFELSLQRLLSTRAVVEA